ncbi:hypothetical protein CW745_16210 [Psychromonas sp. psych-6C06]|uniref:transglycosylase SLT domain-containing protein n=1 Tax=Psychromonas sp. psych-6C06 TaxID=2058089 RepID=UPI000C334A73|nr:hypothetical protein [Psychromonas sp. psych-6C06]PKF60215.1 hypothetical protein CW745_16210 [Psychromonas sp. psych-6C06]
MKIKKKLIFIFTLLILSGCATPPPKNPDNICEIFFEHRDWYKASKKMNEKWGTPIHVPLAMMYQESSFKHNAAPPMQYFWFIPIGRASDAYGYAQAKTMTWDDYQRETGNSWASRSDFDDAIDFMGWFTHKTQKVNGVSKWDAYAQYLNYHEGWGGYKNKSYNKKPWLIKVSRTVDARSKKYAAQLRGCKENLDSSWLWRLFFA